MQVTSDWIQTMARYNAWQNQWMIPAVDGLDPAERELDRGGFFGSIRGTLSHLLWGDSIWLSRFEGRPEELGQIGDSSDQFPDWEALKQLRYETDAGIQHWAAGLSQDDCTGEISWFSGAMDRDVTRPRAVIFTHFFNHQTHHRGQVHAMLTAAGVKTGTTDLAFMPD